MRKLYTDVSLETPFMVSYNDVQIQACANDEDTVTIGATEYIRLTDENGHNVSDGEGNQLLLNDGVIYKVVSGVPESTNVQVTDVIIPERYTLTINPTPNDATVILTAAGETQVGNSITADDGTTVSYTVSKTGYITSTGTYTLDGADHTISVTLEPEAQSYTVTVYPTPNDATVSFICSDAGATTSGNSITCAENSTLSYTISAQGYDSYTCPTFTVEYGGSSYMSLLQTGYYAGWESSEEFAPQQIYTDTASPVIGDFIYDGEGNVTGETVQEVRYEQGVPIISQYGNDFHRLGDLDYNPNPQPITYTYTVKTIPADATVELNGSQGGYETGNSITGLQYDETVSYRIERIGYQTTQGTTGGITSDTNETIPVNAYSLTPANYSGEDNAFWFLPSDLQYGVALFYQNEYRSLNVTPDSGGAFIGIDVNNPAFGTFTDGLETYHPLIAYDPEIKQPLGYVCLGDTNDISYNMPLCTKVVNGDTLTGIYVWNLDDESMSQLGIQFLPIQ